MWYIQAGVALSNKENVIFKLSMGDFKVRAHILSTTSSSEGFVTVRWSAVNDFEVFEVYRFGNTYY